MKTSDKPNQRTFYKITFYKITYSTLQSVKVKDEKLKNCYKTGRAKGKKHLNAMWNLGQ